MDSTDSGDEMWLEIHFQDGSYFLVTGEDGVAGRKCGIAAYDAEGRRTDQDRHEVSL